MKKLCVTVAALCTTLIALASCAVHHSGYITVDEEIDGNMFYYLAESWNNPAKDPVILWLTGDIGTECSSMLHLFSSNGPFRVNAAGNGTKGNENSWNRYANVLWIDQPLGTGFSYASKDFIRTEKEVVQDVYIFLQKFFKKYPQYVNQDFYVGGEFYGGHYVPALSSLIHNENKKSDNGIHINLKGIMIGSGWVDASIQYSQYLPFAQKHLYWVQFDNFAKSINQSVEFCQQSIAKHDYKMADIHCNDILRKIVEATGTINLYDYEMTECPTNPPLCADFENVVRYLNNATVKEQLGVRQDIKWQVCNYNGIPKFKSNWYESFSKYIPQLLDDGIKVLGFHGDFDFISNWYGALGWMQAMDWKGKEAFNKAYFQNWSVGYNAYGSVKSAKGLYLFRSDMGAHRLLHFNGWETLMMLSDFLDGTFRRSEL